LKVPLTSRGGGKKRVAQDEKGDGRLERVEETQEKTLSIKITLSAEISRVRKREAINRGAFRLHRDRWTQKGKRGGCEENQSPKKGRTKNRDRKSDRGMMKGRM